MKQRNTSLFFTLCLVAFLALGSFSNTKAQSRLAIDKPASGTGVVLQNPDNGSMIFKLGTKERMCLTNGGILGIGTNTTNTPEGKLTINQVANTGLGLVIKQNDNGEKIYLHLADNGSGEYGYLSLGGNTSLRGNGQPSFFEGNVGIGTTSPGSKLHVNMPSGNLDFDQGIRIQTNWGNFEVGRGGGIVMQNADVNTAGVFGIRESNSWAGALTFYTHTFTSGNTFGNSFTEKMRITGNGNVGIGTTSPGAKLNVLSSAIGGREDIFKAEVSDASGDYLKISNLTGSSGQFMPAVEGHRVTDERLALALLASTDPSKDAGNHALMVFDSRRSNGPISTRPLFSWASYGAEKMKLSANGQLNVYGNIYANNFPTSSDIRFKKEIQTLTASKVSKLDQVRGTSYTFRTQEFKNRGFSKGNQMGFIAQELIKVYPELVSKDTDGYYSVNYTGLIPVLVEAVKDLRKKNNVLKNESKSLKAANKAIKTDNQAIKAELNNLKARMEALEKLLLKAKK